MTILVDIFPKDEQYAIDFVRNHIKKTRRFELVLNINKANNTFPEFDSTPLSSFLGETLRYFRETNNLMEKGRAAKIAKGWIEYALDNGVYDEGSGLTGKLEDCEKERVVKENELAELSPKFTKLKQEFIELTEKYNQLKTEYERLRMQNDNK